MNEVSVCRCYLERYQHFVRMAKRSCILIIMIVLVETSMTITRVNRMVAPKGQWHRLRGPLRFCKEGLGKGLHYNARNETSCVMFIPM